MPNKASPFSLILESLRSKIGARGAQRLERAADEVPNLTDLYSPEGLENVFTRPVALSTSITPNKFLELAAPFHTSPDTNAAYMSEMLLGKNPQYNKVRDLMNTGSPQYTDVPHLRFDKYGMADRYPLITGHEGRHRSLAMGEAGVRTPLTALEAPTDTLRAASGHRGYMDREEQTDYIKQFLSGDRFLKELTSRGTASDPELARLMSRHVDINPFAQGGLARMRNHYAS